MNSSASPGHLWIASRWPLDRLNVLCLEVGVADFSYVSRSRISPRTLRRIVPIIFDLVEQCSKVLPTARMLLTASLPQTPRSISVYDSVTRRRNRSRCSGSEHEIWHITVRCTTRVIHGGAVHTSKKILNSHSSLLYTCTSYPCLCRNLYCMGTRRMTFGAPSGFRFFFCLVLIARRYTDRGDRGVEPISFSSL